jgi:hypothetical protein
MSYLSGMSFFGTLVIFPQCQHFCHAMTFPAEIKPLDQAVKPLKEPD